MKTKNKIIVSLIILSIIVLAVFYFLKNKPKEEVVDPVAVLKNIDNIEKSFALKAQDYSKEEMITMASSSLHSWEVFVSNFKDAQPEEYKKTKDWDYKLLAILKHERKANELFLENRVKEAESERAMSQAIYKEIKQENGIRDISEEMLNFYDAVKKVTEAQSKEEILEHLPALKLYFTILKELEVDDGFAAYILQLENTISNLDRLLYGPDFKKAQTELEKVFVEFYMEY